MTVTVDPAAMASTKAPDLVGALRPTKEAISMWTLRDAVTAVTRVTVKLPLRGQAPLVISELGWSREEAAATRARLAAFEEDWDAPGMDAYDAL